MSCFPQLCWLLPQYFPSMYNSNFFFLFTWAQKEKKKKKTSLQFPLINLLTLNVQVDQNKIMKATLKNISRIWQHICTATIMVQTIIIFSCLLFCPHLLTGPHASFLASPTDCSQNSNQSDLSSDQNASVACHFRVKIKFFVSKTSSNLLPPPLAFWCSSLILIFDRILNFPQ